MCITVVGVIYGVGSSTWQYQILDRGSCPSQMIVSLPVAIHWLIRKLFFWSTPSIRPSKERFVPSSPILTAPSDERFYWFRHAWCFYIYVCNAWCMCRWTTCTSTRATTKTTSCMVGYASILLLGSGRSLPVMSFLLVAQSSRSSCWVLIPSLLFSPHGGAIHEIYWPACEGSAGKVRHPTCNGVW